MAPKNHRKDWTAGERKDLQRLARDQNVSTEQIARQLARTVDAVRSEAQRANISLRPKNR